MSNNIYQQILSNLDNSHLKIIKDKNIHLGIFAEPYLSLMMNGKKTIESRFSKKKIVPYNQINKEDIVFVKESSGKVIAYFDIDDILFLDLSKTNIQSIKMEYGNQLCVSNSFWIQKNDSRYATLIFIKNIYKIPPFNIEKRGMQSWIKLT